MGVLVVRLRTVCSVVVALASGAVASACALLVGLDEAPDGGGSDAEAGPAVETGPSDGGGGDGGGEGGCVKGALDDAGIRPDAYVFHVGFEEGEFDCRRWNPGAITIFADPLAHSGCFSCRMCLNYNNADIG